MTTDSRLNSPIPAPSEAQLDAGAERDPNANVILPSDAQPPMSEDQRSTSIDGNAPHTQPEGDFSGSAFPVDADHPESIASTDERLGNVAGVDDLDEDGKPRTAKTPASASAAAKASKGK